MAVPERERGGKSFHLIGSVARACASDDGGRVGREGERERLGGAPLGGSDAPRDFEGAAREGPVEFVGDAGTQRGLVGDLRILLFTVIFVGNGKNGLGARGGEEESLVGDPAAFGGAGEGDDGLLRPGEFATERKGLVGGGDTDVGFAAGGREAGEREADRGHLVVELHAERGGGGTGREIGEGGLQGVGRDVATGHRAGEVGGVGRKLGCVGGDDAIDGRGGGDGIGGLVGGDGYHTGLHALGYRQADLLVGGRDGLAGAQGAVIGEGIEAQRVEVVGGGGGAGEDADGGGLAVGGGFVNHLDFLAGGEGQGEGYQTQEGMNGVTLHRLVYLGCFALSFGWGKRAGWSFSVGVVSVIRPLLF